MWRLNLRRGDSTVFFGRPTYSEDGVNLSEEDVILRSSGKRALYLIHGYNVARADASYREICNRIGDLYDVVVGVWWPGSDLALAFWMACLRADKAGRLLAEAVRKTRFRSVDVEAHSLGCRVALEALRNGMTADNVILAAAAVDNETPLRGNRYYDACLRAGVVFNAYSRNDMVLATAYRLAKMDNALGLTGVARGLTPETYIERDFSHLIRGHSRYKTCAEFYRHWRQLAT